MSIHKTTAADGTVRYLVRWRNNAGKSRSKTLLRERDATILDAEKKRQKAMGELITHERGRISLEDFWTMYWQKHALVHLTQRTRENYRTLWAKHVEPALGSRRLRDITREHIDTLTAKLVAKLAPATVRKCLAILQGVLQCAVDWRYLATNPAARTKKPRLVQREGVALMDSEISDLAAELPDLRSLTIMRLLAYTGLRPGELRALRWLSFTAKLIDVRHAVSSNEFRETKTYKRRTVDFREDARRAMLEWHIANRHATPSDLVFPAVAGSSIWTDNGWKQWQKKVFTPAATRAGLAGIRPYDLRHTFASRLIAEGRDVIYVARQLGHSPTMTLEVYGHLFERQRAGGTAESFDARAIFGAR
jgi:integrase